MPTTDSLSMWRERLQGFSTSGLSITRWCDQQGITNRQFRYWRKKVERQYGPSVSKASASTRLARPEWLPVEVVAAKRPSTGCPDSAISIHVGGAQIEVKAGFDAGLLRSVV
ncbi:MAG TPA: hypothetical protein VGS41_12980, partial [Chthonomonadales bacterium]|nr:hypothetical protein [Chthonomonadales bacterium]